MHAIKIIISSARQVVSYYRKLYEYQSRRLIHTRYITFSRTKHTRQTTLITSKLVKPWYHFLPSSSFASHDPPVSYTKLSSCFYLFFFSLLSALEHAFGDDHTLRATENDRETGQTIRCILNADSRLTELYSFLWVFFLLAKKKLRESPTETYYANGRILSAGILIIRWIRFVKLICVELFFS